MRIFLGLLAFVALLYAAACAGLYFFQRSLIYFPQPGSSARLGASVLRLAVEGGDVLVTTRPRSGRAAVLYFGGNAEDVASSLPELAQAFPEHSLYLMHYRGYGGSIGSPSEAALHQDARALYETVRTRQPQVVVIGRSLGSGIAIRLAAEQAVARLVLVTPYDSLQDLAAQQFPYFPVRWLLADKFESHRYAPRITVPTTLVAAEDDEVIPMESTLRLYRRFADRTATLKLIPQAGHNTLSGSPLYLEALRG